MSADNKNKKTKAEIEEKVKKVKKVTKKSTTKTSKEKPKKITVKKAPAKKTTTKKITAKKSTVKKPIVKKETTKRVLKVDAKSGKIVAQTPEKKTTRHSIKPTPIIEHEEEVEIDEELESSLHGYEDYHEDDDYIEENHFEDDEEDESDDEDEYYKEIDTHNENEYYYDEYDEDDGVEIEEDEQEHQEELYTGREMAPAFNKLHQDVNRKNQEFDKTIRTKNHHIDRSVNMYRKIAFSFIFLTTVLLSVVLYFSIASVTITLIPNQETISNNMIFSVVGSDSNKTIERKAVKGLVKQVKIEKEQEFLSSGKEVVGQEATGKVKIINNYNKRQPLVATTRLRTPDGKQFRIKNTVNVPAGGSVEVDIYADNPSPEMEIGPTKFTIPGLWAGLQDKIYAESKDNTKYGEKIRKKISQLDIDSALGETKQSLVSDVKTQINKEYGDYSQVIYKLDENSVSYEVDSKAGEEKEKFKVFVKANVVIVAFDDNATSQLARQKFISSLTEDKELLNFDQENIIYSLNSYDPVDKTATVNSTFEGRISLKEDSEIVELDKVLGLSNKQLEAYLSDIPEIASYDVEFYPSFIKTVPKLIDKVKIDIKK